MADQKISQLPNLPSPSSNDILPIVHSSTNYSITVSELLATGSSKYSRASTLVIAASNSQDTVNADYVCTGTNDQNTINTAIAALPTASGRIILLDGLYNISSSINCGGGDGTSGVVIQGQGWGTQLKLTNSSNAYIFDFGDSGSPQFTIGVAIRDMYLNCNGSNQSSAGGGIYARGAVWCVFEHLFIQTPWEAGIRFYQDGVGDYGHHNVMQNCLFRDGKNSNGGQGWAIKFEQADENRCVGCTFQDNGHALGQGHDAQIYDTSAGLQSIVGNSFVGGGSGVPMLKTDSSPSRISILGNQFDGAIAQHAVELAGTGCQVVGNTFLQIGDGASGNVSGLHINSTSGHTIRGNQFTSSGSHAIGILEDSGSTGNTISGNTFSGTFASGPIVLATSSTTYVYGNQGALNQLDSVVTTITVAASNSKGPADANYICTGTNDHTTINTAISALPAAGGRVILSDGTFNLGGAIVISSSYIVLEGQGGSTELFVSNGADALSAISITGTGTVQYGVKKLRIEGNSANQTNGNGINVNTPWQNATNKFDPNGVFEDIFIDDVKNNGFAVTTSADTRVMHLKRVRIRGALGNAFYMPAPSCTDSILDDCIAETAALNGFYVGGLNCHFINCKAFYCGSTDGNNHGFNIIGYNNYFMNCEAQDNYQSGFYGDGTAGDATYHNQGCTFTNCIADSNNQSADGSYGVGFQLVNCVNWQIIGGITMTRPYPDFTQRIGISLQGTTTGTLLEGISFYNNTTGFSDTSSGINYRRNCVGQSTELSTPMPARQMFHAYEDFISEVNSSTFLYTGSGSNSANTSLGNTSAGEVFFNTGSGTTGNYGVWSGNTANFFFNTSAIWKYEQRVQIPTLSDGTNTFQVFAGFMDTSTGESSNGVYFSYTNGNDSGKFECVTATGGTRTRGDSGVAAVAATWYTLRIEVLSIGGTLTANFYINDALVVTQTTNIPHASANATGYGTTIVKSAGSSNRDIIVDYIEVIGFFVGER